MESVFLKTLWPLCLHLSSAEAGDLGSHKQSPADGPGDGGPCLPCTILAPCLGEQGTLFVKQPTTQGGNFEGSSCTLRVLCSKEINSSNSNEDITRDVAGAVLSVIRTLR